MTQSNMTVVKLQSEMVKEFEELRTTSYENPVVISDEEAEDIKSFIQDQIDKAYSKGREEVDSGNVSMTIEVAMGYIEMGQYKKALEHLEVAQRLLTPELLSIQSKGK